MITVGAADEAAHCLGHHHYHSHLLAISHSVTGSDSKDSSEAADEEVDRYWCLVLVVLLFIHMGNHHGR